MTWNAFQKCVEADGDGGQHDGAAVDVGASCVTDRYAT
ncbi:unnamed protein product, partial [marine sediment metagenome]